MMAVDVAGIKARALKGEHPWDGVILALCEEVERFRWWIDRADPDCEAWDDDAWAAFRSTRAPSPGATAGPEESDTSPEAGVEGAPSDADVMRAILDIIWNGRIVRLRMAGTHMPYYVVTLHGIDEEFGEWEEAARFLIECATPPPPNHEAEDGGGTVVAEQPVYNGNEGR